MSNFEGIVQGNIIQRDRKFYLKVKGRENLKWVWYQRATASFPQSCISLFEDGSKIRYENASCLDDLTHNAVVEEFDDLYNREQGLIYDNRRK